MYDFIFILHFFGLIIIYLLMLWLYGSYIEYFNTNVIIFVFCLARPASATVSVDIPQIEIKPLTTINPANDCDMTIFVFIFVCVYE